MGEAKTRRGDPELVRVESSVALEVSHRTLRRLAIAIAVAQGADAVARAAAQAAQAAQASMLESVSAVAESHGIEMPRQPVISIDHEAGTLRIMTPEAMAAESRGEASGSQGEPLAAPGRRNGRPEQALATEAAGDVSG